jgi:hypothetical protein
MTSRKSSFMTTGLSPIPSAAATGARGNMAMIMKQKQQQQQQAVFSKEYLQAVQTLNEATMTHACELLLSSMSVDAEEKSSGNGEEGKQETDTLQPSSVSQQLQDMYFKAEEALQVIRTHEPIHSNTMPNVPSLSGPAGRILPRTGGLNPTNPTINKPTSLAQLAKPVAGHSLKSGVFPVRRTIKPSMHHHLHHHHHHHHTSTTTNTPTTAAQVNTKRTLNELRGTTAATISAGLVSHSMTKKPRLSSLPSLPTPQALSDTTTTLLSSSSSPSSISTAEAPPPSALSFLAKLNKKQNKKKTTPLPKPPTEEDEEEEEKEESETEQDHHKEKESAEGGLVDKDDPSQSLRRRKNPSRGFHPNRK